MAEHEVMASVARTVRAIRRGRGLSADQLAARAGVSKGALVALENASANPNLATLVRLADALGVPVSELVGDTAGRAVRTFDPASCEPLWHGPDGGTARLILTTATAAPVELWQWDLGAGERYDSHPHPAGVVETLTVVRGSVLLVVDGASQPLGTGMSATYHADTGHSYQGGEPDGGWLLMTVHLPAPAQS
ncbi:MAG: helix-turn-helix domain-containing protein [Actinomycetota bacterium]